jgi:vesicle-associated membrane protein 7
MVLPIIKKDDPSETRRSYDKDSHSVHLLMKKPANNSSDGRLVFLAVAEKAAGKGVPYGFLQTLQDKFFAAFDPQDTDFGALPSYGCASFNGELKKLMMHQGGTVAGQEDALRTAQREIDGVREIMTENIERVLERGEHMSVLVDKTGRLGDNARDFRVRSRTLRRKMWWKNVKLMALLCVVCLFLIYIFVGFGCGLPGTSCSKFVWKNTSTNIEIAWGRCLHR